MLIPRIRSTSSNPLSSKLDSGFLRLLLSQHFVAERGGFEPPVRFLARMFSKHVVSATHPPLLRFFWMFLKKERKYKIYSEKYARVAEINF